MTHNDTHNERGKHEIRRLRLLLAGIFFFILGAAMVAIAEWPTEASGADLSIATKFSWNMRPLLRGFGITFITSPFILIVFDYVLAGITREATQASISRAFATRNSFSKSLAAAGIASATPSIPIEEIKSAILAAKNRVYLSNYWLQEQVITDAVSIWYTERTSSPNKRKRHASDDSANTLRIILGDPDAPVTIQRAEDIQHGAEKAHGLIDACLNRLDDRVLQDKRVKLSRAVQPVAVYLIDDICYAGFFLHNSFASSMTFIRVEKGHLFSEILRHLESLWCYKESYVPTIPESIIKSQFLPRQIPDVYQWLFYMSASNDESHWRCVKITDPLSDSNNDQLRTRGLVVDMLDPKELKPVRYLLTGHVEGTSITMLLRGIDKDDSLRMAFPINNPVGPPGVLAGCKGHLDFDDNKRVNPCLLISKTHLSDICSNIEMPKNGDFYPPDHELSKALSKEWRGHDLVTPAAAKVFAGTASQ